MRVQVLRYAILLHSGDPESGYTHDLVSTHRTKAATLRAWKRAKREAAWMYEEEWHFVECYYWDVEAETYSYFMEGDYQVCPVEQFGECDLCQQRERPCYGRYADGRCKKLAVETKGPWRVYCLVDPTDGRTRYVGSTEQPLQNRLYQHLCPNYGAKGEWIISLLAQGLKPAIHEIAVYDTWKEAIAHEYQMINTLPGLTNAQRNHSALGSGSLKNAESLT